MKKLSLFLGMAVAASLSLTYCAKNEIAPSEPVNKDGVPFEISASLSTKTVNDGLATKWAEGDKINLFHAVAGSTTYTSDNAFTLDANREGVFTGTLTGTLTSGTNYDWYAIYPYEEVLETPANNAETKKYIYVGGRSDTPAVQDGNNSMAHLVGDYAPLWGKALGVASDVMPSMQMLNLASVVAVKVKNTTSEPLTVSSVSLTSKESLVGTFYVDITGENVKYVDGTYTSSTATLKVNGATALANGEEAIFYIPIKPHTEVAGSKLTLSVNSYEKESPALTKDVTFTAGKIKTLVFEYDKVVVDYVTLPWEIDGTGGSNTWKNTIGLSQSGLGSDYALSNSPYLTKFDTTNDYVQVKYDSPAKQIRFTVKKLGGEGESSFSLKGSVDGSNFAEIETFKVTGTQNAVLTFVSNNPIDDTYRYLRLVFTKKSNVGLGSVSILANSTDPVINADNIAGISALGEGAGALAYTIDNPVEGTTISAACDGTIVTDVLDNGDGKTFLYEVSKNTGDAREGWIKLTYGDVEKTVKVSQNAPIFKVSKTEVELEAENSSQRTITITSDFGWTATTSTGADFLIDPENYTEGKATDGKTTMTIMAGSANTSEEGAKALGTITITNKETGVILTVNVSQASSYQPPYITLSANALTVAADAETAEFTVDANVDYTIHTDAEWILDYDKTKPKDGNVVILFEANTESTARTAVFAVTSTDNTISKTFTLTQSAAGVVKEQHTVIYTVASVSSVTTSGTAPDGSSVSFKNTYGTKDQITSDKSQTYTMSGFEGKTIKKVVLSMHSNGSKGAGKFSLVAGDTTLASIEAATTFNNWYDNTSYGTTYRDVTVKLKNDSYVIGTDENVVLVITGTTNSIYCQSVTITYE